MQKVKKNEFCGPITLVSSPISFPSLEFPENHYQIVSFFLDSASNSFEVNDFLDIFSNFSEAVQWCPGGIPMLQLASGREKISVHVKNYTFRSICYF